jgi:hypothetical protein
MKTVTLEDLFRAVQDSTTSDEEAVAVMVHLLQTRRVVPARSAPAPGMEFRFAS